MDHRYLLLVYIYMNICIQYYIYNYIYLYMYAYTVLIDHIHICIHHNGHFHYPILYVPEERSQLGCMEVEEAVNW